MKGGAMRAVAAIVVMLSYLLMPARAQASIDVTIGEPIGKAQLDFGVTYTQHTLRTDENPEAVKSAKSILHRVAWIGAWPSSAKPGECRSLLCVARRIG
jgi:hypothetical protein